MKMAYCSAGRPTVCASIPQANFPDMEMVSLRESLRSRSYSYDPHHLKEEDLRRLLIVAAEITSSGGIMT